MGDGTSTQKAASIHLARPFPVKEKEDVTIEIEGLEPMKVTPQGDQTVARIVSMVDTLRGRSGRRDISFGDDRAVTESFEVVTWNQETRHLKVRKV